jgi:hypothetical protein
MKNSEVKKNFKIEHSLFNIQHSYVIKQGTRRRAQRD